MRLGKIVTKTGDKGETTLGAGEKVSKDHPRIQVLGELDELNSLIGWARTALKDHPQDKILKNIQNDIFNLGGQVSLPSTKETIFSIDSINYLDNEIEQMNEMLPPLKEFIIPGGKEASSRLHIVRSFSRRVERSFVVLSKIDQTITDYIPYLNRLSDYLFVLCRISNLNEAGIEDQWKH